MPLQDTPEAIYLSDLATALFPRLGKDSAVRSLKRMMRRNPLLLHELEQTCYDFHSQVLTPRQAALVRRHLIAVL